MPNCSKLLDVLLFYLLHPSFTNLTYLCAIYSGVFKKHFKKQEII